MDLNSDKIGIRTHDVNHGLVVVSSALVEQYCRKTRLVGTAAQLASLIADQDVVAYDSLVASAVHLQINAELVDRALDVLQETEFARVLDRSSGKVIEVRASGIKDRYKRFGESWLNNDPSEIEKVTIAVIDELAAMPRKRHELQSKFDLNAETLDLVKDIGENAGVVEAYESPIDGEEIWFSPIYWSENPKELFELSLDHESDDIAAAIKGLRDYAGMPDTKIEAGVMADVVKTGIFPMPAIKSEGGKHNFAFLPPQGLKLEEKSIADRAMALVACARYAEHFAKRKLRLDPVILLRALRGKKRLNPHSEAMKQWGPLATLRVVRIEPVKGGLYQVHFIDSPENVRALEVAIQLLTVGETEYEDKDVEHARQLVIPGMYDHHTPARIQLRRAATHSSTGLERVHQIIGGVSPDIAVS